uniref:Phosphoinositide phospholipase C n=1 Tax=Panagrolaimus davidi TaxID=227884 RepID=A0A914QSJ1_9BILA
MGHGMDIEKDCVAMELGHKVCRLQLMKKWEPLYKRLSYKRETQELVLTKWDSTTTKTSKQTLDLKWIKEVQTVHYKMTQMNIEDKWKKDREVRRLDSELLLDITYGTSFVLNHMILLFENKDTCKLWNRGINYLITETQHASHCLQVERWMRKQFSNLLVSDSINSVSMKQMKPFVQVVLQYKAQAKDLQEISEGEMDYEAFASAVQRLLNFDALFDNFFNGIVKHTNRCISLDQFFSFLNKEQKDEWAANKEQTYEFLKTYLREVDLARDTVDPHLTCEEFVDYLFSSENTVFDPINNKVTHDMNQPLTNYWIASSHNTYLTGDQIKSDSSLDAYANSLMMGCRCVELDCWDGTKKTNGEPNDVVIYHGYTMTSKINLRDVLNTIKHYAFVTSEYPVILSIEDNCSVPFQRLMAQAFKECLGDLLLTSPLSKDETHLPSPAALRRRIILKHKKLRLENNNNDDDDQDILSKDSVKRGMMYLRDNTHYTWTRHVFVLFDDKLCYVTNPVDSDALTKGKEDNGDEDQQDESALKGFGIRPDEMHVTEEWYHGNIDRKVAEKRLMEQIAKGDGVFLVRDGGTFIGNYTVSFLQEGHVHHIRIETQIIKGEKRFYFFEHKQMDTLYELISYYTKHYLSTSKFHTHLNTACPQPQPHLGEPWFSPQADAEKLLNTINEDGAFLIRYSQSDPSVFVLSLRVNGEIWHYRLKRDGRIFVINQTVFENLNRVVEYYKTHEFVSGVTLRFPVNEKNVGQFAQVANSPGFYKDLADLEKETEAIALHAYSGPDSSYLCFPANAVITIVSKKNNLNNMWKGRYDNSTGLFPPEMVKELTNNGGSGSNEAVSHFTIELANTIVEKVSKV